jgi:hypothetical protein
MDDAYNYREFPTDLEQERFAAFAEVLRPGSRAPDGELVDAVTGETVTLSSLWKAGPLVIEFGSFS